MEISKDYSDKYDKYFCLSVCILAAILAVKIACCLDAL